MQSSLTQRTPLVSASRKPIAGQLGLIIFCLLTPSAFTVALGQESYPVHPDSQRQAGVPQGRVESFQFSESKVYPGTQRDYFVYVPAQYDPIQPAALMVFQDGRNYVQEKSGWRVPVVFDNLIARGEMPVTIAVCINPGVVSGDANAGGGEAATAQDRFNRSLEYDTASDRYATFLIDELLPEVAQKYKLTDDPNLRGIGGSSSGAIAAFGVAWHRPDQFRRVFSTVGTYVGLRGGNEYPTLIRKMEPKPLRVFLQDGSNDLNIYGGSWWNANQTMLSALQWAGYEVEHAWGEGGHNGKHGTAILPDAMRWLWKDFQEPITTHTAEHPEMKLRVESDEAWQRISTGHVYTEGPAVAPDGSVYFVDGVNGEVWRIADPDAEKPTVEKFVDLPGASGLMFDEQGRLYCARNKAKMLTRIDPDGSQVDLMQGKSCNDLVVLPHGVYFSGPDEQAVWYLPHGGEVVKAGEGPEKPNGLIVTPDQRFLLVIDAMGRYVWSYRIENDGRLTQGQPYSYMHLSQDSLKTGADGCTMTADGELIVATELGLQVFDQPGRVHLIIQRPRLSGRLSNCVFAGNDFQTLFVTNGDSVYRRRTLMTGIAPWQPPAIPPKPRL
ncbi:SMP-30/gluconolactonase/LRE family protein [Stieleria varia]|uniref:Gluconolactonase n=1 Tax=Stieleria varia TaxID=2528005 RepID=A0A5C6AXF0_9BACT|nr:SMP-30/gluconolactonase/LRE family protein [Stieleria varia]TWU02804.1 Gluconolactonase precursor [Stieleria varia]